MGRSFVPSFAAFRRAPAGGARALLRFNTGMWSAVSKRAVLLSRPLSQAVAPNLVRPSAASLDAAVNGVAAAAAQQQQVVQVPQQRPQQHEVDVRQQQTQEPAIFSESLSPVVMSEPEIMRPKISVVGVGGAGSNAVNNMIVHGLEGVEFVVCNTDAQALEHSMAPTRVQLGGMVTQGLGAGAKPEIGRKSAIESTNDLLDHVADSHMCFVTAGLGGGTGTGAGPIVARALRDRGVLTVGVVTKPFPFEGITRKRVAEAGLADMQAWLAPRRHPILSPHALYSIRPPPIPLFLSSPRVLLGAGVLRRHHRHPQPKPLPAGRQEHLAGRRVQARRRRALLGREQRDAAHHDARPRQSRLC